MRGKVQEGDPPWYFSQEPDLALLKHVVGQL